MSEARPYKMSISLNVLNHLGIGLYSNVPAVLSEVVANSYDADASFVKIDIDQQGGAITIHDDGWGMTQADINDKYLNVGYQKRVKDPGPTPKGRAPMGRKGIGKLAVFSIADTVEVYSAKGGERSGLAMNSQAIKEQIEANPTEPYLPIPRDTGNIDFEYGTLIVLRDLKRSLDRTESFLRKRLARRFSIIGARNDFEVIVGEKPITANEREYYDNIEFVWHIGELDPGFYDVDGKLRTNISRRKSVSGIVNELSGYAVTGWIGTVDEQKNIDDDNNTIVVMAHGKLIQEDVLRDLKEAGVYSKYLIGEIEADFMDLDTEEDIVTSARQSVKEDDERYQQLKEYVRRMLKGIQNEWTQLRVQVGVERATRFPAIKGWYEQLKGDNKRYAGQLFGKIESLKITDPAAKKELYKATMLGFESLALRNQLSTLDALESEADFELFARIFQDIDDLEAAHYYNIIKGRLEVLKEFERISTPETKERLLQQHIFKHLWLLDPSWERAAADPRIEQSVETEFGKIDAKLTDDEKKGRIDIRYKTAAGKNIIVELKKFDRKVSVYDLLEQVRKYESALRKVITTKYPGRPNPIIETILILGGPPTPQEQDAANRRLLGEVNARYVTYDELIDQTKESYRDYLEKQKTVSSLIAMIDKLDDDFKPLIDAANGELI